METYLKFNPLSTIRVEETRIVEGYQVVLRHIPKRGSVVINGFMEVASDPAPYQFACQYSDDSVYREANRVLIFNPANNAQEFLISYIAVGTVITADDMNEIKAHLENQELHGSADNFFHKVGNFVCFPYVAGNKSSWSVAQYEQDFQAYAGRPSQNYDIVFWNDSGMTNGWAIRVGDKWFNLGVDTYNAGQLQSGWNLINPLLSFNDRQKLDSLTEPYQIGDGFYLQNNKLYLQTANANTLGGVKVGDGLQLNNSAALCLKAATASQLGGIKIGNGLVKDLHEVLSVDLPLSNADRKLLDYLHEQFDDQID